MPRGAYEFDIEAYADSPEQIRKCLNCQRTKCNQCRSTGIRDKAVIGRGPNGEILRFETITAAAEHFATSKGNLSHALKNGGKARGYFWSYAEAGNGAEV